MDPLLPGGMGWDCIWVTPVVKDFYGPDLGQSGYGYHGYWTEDFTQIDPNFGTADDLKELVQETHKHGSLGKTWWKHGVTWFSLRLDDHGWSMFGE